MTSIRAWKRVGKTEIGLSKKSCAETEFFALALRCQFCKTSNFAEVILHWAKNKMAKNGKKGTSFLKTG